MHLARAHVRLAAPRAPPRSSPPPAARTCRGRGGARCPARSGSGPPAARPRSASASVGPRWPGAGMGHEPGRLVHHQQVGVLVDDLELRRRLVRRAGGVRSGLDRHDLPGGDAVVLRPAPRPSTQHRAARRSAAAPPSATARRRARPGRRPGAARRPRRSPLGAALAAASPPPPTAAPARRSRCSESATLNAGQAIGSMKSITAPSRARSARLPSAPPSSMPTGSQSQGRSRLTREVADQQRQRERRSGPRRSARRPRAPRRPRPCCACW